MAVGVKDHERFCKLDGWERIPGDRHIRYKKNLPDGTVLLTMVSKDQSKEYGQALWKTVWKEQLQLKSADDFHEVLRTRRPADRSHLNEPELIVEDTNEIPYWLVEQLKHTVGLSEEEIATMDFDAAQRKWDVHCGVAEPTVGDLSQGEITELLEMYAGEDLTPADQDYLFILQQQAANLESVEIEAPKATDLGL